jgi:hypothetical protein
MAEHDKCEQDEMTVVDSIVEARSLMREMEDAARGLAQAMQRIVCSDEAGIDEKVDALFIVQCLGVIVGQAHGAHSPPPPHYRERVRGHLVEAEGDPTPPETKARAADPSMN